MPPDRISVIALPVSDNLVKRGFHSLRAPQSQAQLVTVGRIARAHRYKGHLLVAESLPLILRRRPEARWVVVGEGDDLPALRARCAALRVSGAVNFLGAVSDEELADVYENATLLVLPSAANVHVQPPTGEGFGLVYAEAAAFGVPSIACSSGGGSTEIVQHEHTGLTVPPGSKDALAAAILRLIEDRDLRERLGSSARRLVAQRHLPIHFAEELATLARPTR